MLGGTMAKKKPDRAGDRHATKRVVRIPDDVHRAMTELAEESERSLGREVKLALIEYLKARGKWPPPGGAAPEPKPGRPRKGGG
jgi:hypothetical protein